MFLKNKSTFKKIIIDDIDQKSFKTNVFENTYISPPQKKNDAIAIQ